MATLTRFGLEIEGKSIPSTDVDCRLTAPMSEVYYLTAKKRGPLVHLRKLVSAWETKFRNLYYQLMRKRNDKGLGLHVLLFPEGELDSRDQLWELITKLRWYLPDDNRKLIFIHYINSRDLRQPNSYEWLGSYQERRYHPRQHKSLEAFRVAIPLVNLILVWNKADEGRAKAISRPTEKVVNVDKFDPESEEYGKLASLAWDHIFEHREKDWLINRSLGLLGELRDDWRIAHPSSPSLVVATGPSYSAQERIDSTGALVIACNSIAADGEFFAKHNPKFFVFGDGAHHAGASKPAQIFREHLQERLAEFPGFYVVTTDKFAGVLEQTFSEYWDRFLFFRQSGSRKPVIDIIRQRRVPSYDSVLTIHMLPLAYTFTQKMFLIGADGINPAGENEDFWAHDKRFFYGDTVDLVHRAHPTFEYHRSVRLRDLPPTSQRYEAGLHETFELSEIIHGKKNFALTPSFTAPVQKRLIEDLPIGPIKLLNL